MRIVTVCKEIQMKYIITSVLLFIVAICAVKCIDTAEATIGYPSIRFYWRENICLAVGGGGLAYVPDKACARSKLNIRDRKCSTGTVNVRFGYYGNEVEQRQHCLQNLRVFKTDQSSMVWKTESGTECSCILEDVVGSD